VREPAAGAGKKGGRGGRRKRMAPTGGPHLSAAERERRWERGAAFMGRGWAGLLGQICFFFFFFFSNPFSNLLNSNLFHVFKLKF
jgi:hypothetical protein